MEIQILDMLEGAKQAQGLTVIIDVFRAFTAECFLYQKGVDKIWAFADEKKCLELKKENPSFYLVGEINGVKVDGFDVGNSPSQIVNGPSLDGRIALHRTSAGTQGVVNAVNADEIITGSFVNAKAIAKYIKQKNPKMVSLVAMGLNAVSTTEEDTLCAKYIKSLLEDRPMNILDELSALSRTSGAKFFDSLKQTAFPEPDFFMCLVPNIFDFVLKANQVGNLIEIEKIPV